MPSRTNNAMTPGSSNSLNDSLGFVEGDTWGGIPALFITVNGTPPASDATSCIFLIKEKKYTPDELVRLTEADGITITSANLWQFAIAERNLDLKAGTYYWSFRVTDAASVVRTYLAGEFTVEKSL